MDWFMRIFIGVVVLMLTGIFYFTYVQSQKPTFAIVKEDFSCTQSHKQLRFTLVGKVSVPVWDNICDQYMRNNK